MDHNILFVDDEENILTAMKRIFHASPFNLFFAASGEEGLDILREHEVGVIISDMKMPGMSGIEFLRASEDYAPYAIRIILSGYSDINDILNAVNEGHIHNYLTKPWENERLKIVLYNATISYEKNIRMKNLAEELRDKNARLERINSSLEEVVEQKNRELTLRNAMLMSILKDPDPARNLNKCLDSIETLLGGPGWDIHLHLCEGFNIPGIKTKGKAPSAKIIEILKDVRKPAYVNENFILPLEVKHRIACYLILSPFDKEKGSELSDVISFSPMIKLIIQQHYNISESRNLMDSIDDLLEDL